MVEGLTSQLAFTLVFAATGGYALLRLVRARTVHTRVELILHAAMAAAMIAMTWPAGMSLPAVPQIAVFVVGAVWFCVRAVQRLLRPSAVTDLGHSAGMLFFHAGMMAGMCWMLLAMSATMSGHTAEAHGGSMSGLTAGTVPLVLVVAGLAMVSTLLGGSAIAIADVANRKTRRPQLSASHRRDDLAAVVMALGMAAMSVPLLAV